MGKLRKKHNWKGRQQSDPQQPADEEKTQVVVELKGRNHHQQQSGAYLSKMCVYYQQYIVYWKYKQFKVVYIQVKYVTTLVQ